MKPKSSKQVKVERSCESCRHDICHSCDFIDGYKYFQPIEPKPAEGLVVEITRSGNYSNDFSTYYIEPSLKIGFGKTKKFRLVEVE
jgi:hypothetical protein